MAHFSEFDGPISMSSTHPFAASAGCYKYTRLMGGVRGPPPAVPGKLRTLPEAVLQKTPPPTPEVW